MDGKERESTCKSIAFFRMKGPPTSETWRAHLEQDFPAVFIKDDTGFLPGISDSRFCLDQFPLHWDQSVERRNFHAPMISQAETSKVQQLVDAMVARGVIEVAPIASQCVYHPVIVIPKKDPNKLRFLVDMRGINLFMNDLGYDMKERSKIVQSVPGSARVFSSLDIRDAFFQIHIKGSHLRNLFGVHLLGQFYRFTRLPQGLKISPTVCQLVYENILFPECSSFCVVYMDDLLIYSENSNQHWDHIRTVFQILQKYKIQLSPAKAQLCQHEVEYLGVIFSYGKRHPSPKILEKLQVLTSMNLDDQDVWKTCQGLLIQYVNYGPRIPQILNHFRRGTRQERAEILNRIAKWTICNATGKVWTLMTDWSPLGRGYVLLVDDKTVLWNSKKNNPTQSRMSSFLGELDVITWALSETLVYWRGRPVTVKTDSQSFVKRFRNLHKAENEDGRVLRRIDLLLSIPGIEIQFTPRAYNQIADGLSKVSLLTVDRHENELSKAHQGHFGYDRTIKNLELDGASWSTMKEDCQTYIQRCAVCQQFGRPKRSPPWRTAQEDQTNKLLFMDIAGPWKWARSSDKIFAIIIIDSFSRLLFVQPCTIADGVAVRSAVQSWSHLYGKPGAIQTDNGRCFLSNVYTAYLQAQGISARLSAVYMPASNGLVERSISTLLNRLRKELTFSGWSAMLARAVFSINNSYHISLGHTPLSVGCGILRSGGIMPLHEHTALLQRVQARLIRRAQLDQARHLRRYPQYRGLLVGDLVLKIRFHPTKFSPLWEGPYSVSRCVSTSLFMLSRRGVFSGPFHAHQLKLFFP